MKMKKIIITSLLVIMAIGSSVGYSYYQKIFGGNIKADSAIYLRSNATFDDVLNTLGEHLNSAESFIWVAKKKNYPNKIKGGHYILEKGMNNNDLVDLLRSGAQSPIKVSFNNQDSLEKLAGRIAAQIEADSISLLRSFKDPDFLTKNKLTEATAIGVFIPNSYELYWNTSAEAFTNRMLSEFKKFWNEDRLNKAKRLNLTKNEVITLASIVQKETATVSERPTVAGLYLNRLRSRWPLAADPTILFALRKKNGQDKIYKRVLNKDLEIDSPYNTYKNLGLPPGPIGMPDISSIDAVLRDMRHNYYFMCVDVEKLGHHAFAETLEEHNRNARKYHQWVNEQGILR